MFSFLCVLDSYLFAFVLSRVLVRFCLCDCVFVASVRALLRLCLFDWFV